MLNLILMDALHALNILYAIVAILYYLDMLVRKNVEQPIWRIWIQNSPPKSKFFESQTFSKKSGRPTKPKKLN